VLKIFERFRFQDMNDFSKLPRVSHFTYNYLLGVAMLYMMFMILSGLLIYKVVRIGGFLAPAAIFVTPMIYCLSNVTTEVYGYQIGRNMMWWFVISSAVFTGFSGLLIHIQSPPDFKNQAAFELILGSMPWVFVAGIIGTICGITFNNFVVSKCKVIMEGKRYWLRSLISTCGGEVVYNVIAYPIMLCGHFPLDQILHMFVCVTLFKIATTVVFLPPECLLARYLKIKEKINTFDYQVSYNIFRFKLSEPSHNPHLKLVKNS
jgi:queuosine precursor transporter